MAETDMPAVLSAILGGYSLNPWGAHGIGHWARVLANGRRLAEQTGADLEVVTLFAVLHDSRRRNEYTDSGHGRRGAALAIELSASLFLLAPARLGALTEACADHTGGKEHADVTVRTCWDADRLDLGRVGKTPDPGRMLTEPAREPGVICWADNRARRRHIPSFVLSEWELREDPQPPAW